MGEGLQTADRGWPPRLAPPATRLGQLQRGLGSGIRWAMEGGDESRTALLHCLTVEPRWDRQLDEQADAYAALMPVVGLGVDVLLPLIESVHAGQLCELEGRTPIALDVLDRCAQRGDQAAVNALTALASGAGAFAERAADELEWLADRMVPWQPVAASGEPERASPVRPDPYAELEPAELVSQLEVAAVDVAPGQAHRQFRAGLDRLPIALSRPLATRWLEASDDELLRRAGSSAFGAHAEPADIPFVRRMLTRELSLGPGGEQYIVCDFLEALGRHPERGPFPEIRRAFSEMPYAFGRRFAAEALARTDPAFGSTLAVSGLWDCGSTVRSICVEAVDLAQPGVRERLAELIVGYDEDPSTIERARERLAA